MKNEQAPLWFRSMAWLCELRSPWSVAGLGLIVFSVCNGAWVLAESKGIEISAIGFSILIVASGTAVGLFVLIIRALRWAAIFAATKQYASRVLVPKVITEETVLVGAGTGSAIALGILSKALKELGHEEPLSVVLDGCYGSDTKPLLASLLGRSLKKKNLRILIVLSHVGLSKWLETLRAEIGQEAPVFALVVSEDATVKAQVEYYLHVGGRAMIPWPPTGPKPSS